MERNRVMRVFILLGMIVVSAASIQTSKFQHISAFDGYIDLTNIIKTTTVRSVLECTKSCDQNSECVAFYFTPSSKECQQQSILSTTDMTVKVPQSGSRYYRIHVPVPFVCPVQNGTWVTNLLPDGSYGQYIIVNDVTVNQQEAKTYCEARDSHLIKLVTADKMNFYLNNIVPCPDVYGFKFWVDGRNTPTNPDHITHDGDVVPLLPELWAAGRPNDLITQNCIQSTLVQFLYMLDDARCDVADHQIICERIVI